MTRFDRAPRLSRRQMLLNTIASGAGLAAAYALTPVALRKAHAGAPYGEVIDTKAYARLETVAEGIWAVVSTPFGKDGQGGDFTTVCNGGIIAGSDMVLAVDGYATPGGAAWLSDQCLALTGRRPTHVVVTHYHGDHTGGLAGFQNGADGPEILSTGTTYDTLVERYVPSREVDGEAFARPRLRLLMPDRIMPDDSAPVTLDLGGRSVTLTLRSGHTDSDVTIAVDDPNVVFAGDLIWEGIFPNFMDTTPSALMNAVRALLAQDGAVIVPGHGPVTPAAGLGNYLALLEEIEAAARNAHEAGRSAKEAADQFGVPDQLGEWRLFSPRYFEVAIGAWLEELA